MFSIIICSINKDRLASIKKNIDATIGVPYEVIAIDNTVHNYPLTKAYNVGAAEAKYPFLCFAHEDIAFHAENWGEKIAEKLSEKTTGVIGFAGSTGKVEELTTWYFNDKYRRFNIVESLDDGRKIEWIENPDNVDFSEVITLDGLCLMVRKEVWAEVRFDEKTFDGFHLYDLDFATAVRVAGYSNFVANRVLVEHFSQGSYGKVWYAYSEKYQEKWANKLPLYVDDLDEKTKAKNEKLARRSMNYLFLRFDIVPRSVLWKKIMRTVRDFPFSYKPYALILLYILRR